MTDLSVIVSGRNLQAVRVRGLVDAWSRTGLLRDSIWVASEDISTHDAGPPTVRASRLSRGGPHYDDLFQLIGSQRLDLLRLVVVHLLPAGQGPDPVLAEHGDLLGDLFRSVLPLSSGVGTPGTRLHMVNLLVPSSGTNGVPLSLLRPGWDVNAVVSPEDRPDLDRASVFVRAPGNYAGHAAGAVAAVAGLWEGVPQGCLDERESDSVTSDDDVLVLRASTRAIVGDNLPRKLADAAVEAIQSDPAGPADLLSWARPARDPAALSQQYFLRLVEHGDWKRQESLQVSAPHLGERTFDESWKEAARFNAKLFTVGFSWAIGRLRQAAEDAATTAIVGRQGDYVIRLEPRSPEAIARMAEVRLELQGQQLQHDMLVKEASSVIAPQPSTWVELRRTCFAMVDGSDPLEGMPVPELAGVRELLPPSTVVPDPADVFRTDAGVNVRACDPGTAARLRTDLAQALDATRAAGQPGVDPREDEPPQEVSAMGDEARAAEIARMEAELVRLDQWLERRRSALLWRLRQDVDDRINGSLARAEKAFAAATAGAAPAVEVVRKAQKRLVRRWQLLALLLVVLIAGNIWYHDWRPTQVRDLVYGLLGSLVLVLLLTVWVNHQFYKSVRQYERDIQRLLAHRRRTAEEYVAEKREAGRLDLLSRAMLDWSDIIGWVLHRPYAAESEPERSLSEESVAGLPAAVALAEPDKGEILPHDRIAAAAEILCSRGWSGRLFDQVTGLTSGFGMPSDQAGYLPADLDTLDSPGSPRRRLLDRFTNAEASRTLTARARELVREAILTDVLTLPPRMVTRRGEFSDGIPVTDDVFFSATLGPPTPFVDSIWTDLGRAQARHVPGVSAAWVPRAAGGPVAGNLVTLPAVGDAAVRADLSRTSTPAHITCFAPDLSVASGNSWSSGKSSEFQ